MSRAASVSALLVAARIAVAVADAQEIKWRKIELDTHRAEACCAMDVNRDGRLDLVSGENWYEAPTWKPHFIRTVVRTGEYANDFLDIPMDVNGDGWMDFVSGAWFLPAVYWYENPQGKEGAWPVHEVVTGERARTWETAVAVDVDGDGRKDILPNGGGLIFWIECLPGPDWKFVIHEVGRNGVGHGIGYGDLDADGRLDIITPSGWYRAPEDRRNGTWEWFGEFQLGSTCVPVLGYDVNGDGLTDIVHGNGHNFGLFWQEQQKDDQGNRRWVQHDIITDLSQFHTLSRADINGDGDLELLTGKRFRAHEHEPGGNLPMVIMWLKYDRQTQTWERQDIDYDGLASTGLGLEVVDIDGDGDLDVACSGKVGFFLFVNQGPT